MFLGVDYFFVIEHHPSGTNSRVTLMEGGSVLIKAKSTFSSFAITNLL